MTPAARAALLTSVQKRLAENALADYKPYAKQIEFHLAGGPLHIRERLLKAGNQLGKCCTAATVLDLPNGRSATYGELFNAGQPFDVMSWDGTRAVVRKAVRPIKKPPEPCVRLWMVDGRWIEVAEKHRMLSAGGAYVFCGSLLASLPSLQQSSLVRGRSALPSGALNWRGKLQGFLAGCLEGFRSCGEQLRCAVSNAQGRLQRPNDARQCGFVLSGLGGYSSTNTSTHQSGFGHHANPGAWRQIEALSVGFLDRAVCMFFQCTTRCIQAGQRHLVALLVRLQSSDEELKDRGLGAALFDPFGKRGNQIIAYELIGSHEVYDFTVPETHNYINAGVVHHNTFSAGAEHAMHLTGRYPDWWKGAVFDEPVIGWAASETGQTTRDTVQRILMGQVDSWGTGAIPKDAIKETKRAIGAVPDMLETVLVRHGGGGDLQAGTSRVTIKTYDQGRLRWQGETLDFVWFDEEPPEDIYFEGLTRTNARSGIVTLTFTPLKGMSNVVRRFLQEKPAGSVVVNMTLADAEHYTPEQRAAIAAAYPAHEREARINGTPTMGSGRVFPIPRETIEEPQVALAPHWPRICGLDFGWDHPTAAAWLAWDRDNDVVHVYDAYRVREATPLVHSLAIKARGEWLPVAWPHDGLQHDKGSGEALADQYRKHGVAMLKDKATHAPLKGETEGSGSNGVEAGVLDMLDRMQTGRLKVAKHLNDWFEEFLLYHREDGKLVKKSDDLMAATRYALMMLRHAKTPKPPVIRRPPPRHAGDAGMGAMG